MMQLEVRTFEQRYGERCPFCDKSWNNPSPCGDSRAEWTIQTAINNVFADRRAKECAICGKGIPGQYTYCYDCGHVRTEAREARRLKEDRHAFVSLTCAWCSKTYEARSDRKNKQRYCSRSCGNRGRYAGL